MNTDIESLQEQIERLSNKLDAALHKLADYQTVVSGAVRDGVYGKNEFWWHELRRLESEQASQQLRAVDGRKASALEVNPETELVAPVEVALTAHH